MAAAAAKAAAALRPLEAAALPRFSQDPQSLLRKVALHEGDITLLKVDVIVNAANSHLSGGGGVDGAIHRRAGPEMYTFNKTLGGCRTGDVKASPGFQLPCQHVFHAVGPRREDPELLRSCYIRSLDLLKRMGLRSIAFPCISTGVYGYPQLNAAKVVTDCVVNWLGEKSNFDAVDLVCFCVFLHDDYEYYQRCLKEISARARVIPASSMNPAAEAAAGRGSEAAADLSDQWPGHEGER